MKTTSPSPHQFSFFTGGIRSTVPQKHLTLQQMFKRITSDRYAAETEAIRAFPPDSPHSKKLKEGLDYIIPAGTFTKRRVEDCVTRSGLLVLDFDNSPNPSGLSKAIRRDIRLGPSLQAAFVSPTGTGLKVLVEVDTGISHQQSYAAIASYLARESPSIFKYLDQSGKDVARACFLCYDPKAYLNPHHRTSTPFLIVTELNDLFDEGKSPFPSSGSTTSDAARIEPWVAAVEAAGDFPDDYDRWYKLAFAFATLGEEGRDYFHRISQLSSKYERATCDQQFTVAARENRNRITLGTFVYYCQQSGISINELTVDTPCLPDIVYDLLPCFLQQCCSPFASKRERDVMLLGSLAVLSGCFPGVGGMYNRNTYGLNLFVFIIAPAASGKGTLAWAQYLARPLHKKMVEDSATALANYAERGEESSPPARQMLFLPGNSTAAAVLTQLNENNGRGIICETEADTLSGALGADFGNFSDMLRKAFQHEPVSVMRKTDRQYIDLERPALSIALTGTPGQVGRLLKSAEDGLVSRMLFCLFSQDPIWNDVGPAAGPSLETYFAPLADQVVRMVNAVTASDAECPYPVQITLTSTDWARLNAAGSAGLVKAHATAGGIGASTAFRLGLIAWRIIGLLTTIRASESGNTVSGTLVAHPDDVSIALSIMDTARIHALEVLHSLSKADKRKGKGLDYEAKAAKIALAQSLRNKGVSIRKIADQINEAKSTVQRWLE